jgi:hypothetical protein
MSEGTFRAVVASVLVGAFVLAVIVAGALLLPRSSAPAPSALATHAPFPSTPTPAPTRSPGPALRADVIGVGQVPRGGESGKTLVLEFLESSVDAIPDAPGLFRVTVTDNAGDGSTVGFVGTPSVEAPGSLGATVTPIASNILQVSIVASDSHNVELLSIRGLGISASTTAALGALKIQLGQFSGSLATGAGSTAEMSPGTVVASP